MLIRTCNKRVFCNTLSTIKSITAWNCQWPSREMQNSIWVSVPWQKWIFQDLTEKVADVNQENILLSQNTAWIRDLVLFLAYRYFPDLKDWRINLASPGSHRPLSRLRVSIPPDIKIHPNPWLGGGPYCCIESNDYPPNTVVSLINAASKLSLRTGNESHMCSCSHWTTWITITELFAWTKSEEHLATPFVSLGNFALRYVY